MALIPLDEAKDHLRIVGTQDDSEVDRKIQMAEAIILNRLNTTDANEAITAAWTEDTVPQEVKTSILLMLAHLWANRGDGVSSGSGNEQPDVRIWQAVDLFLVRYTRSVIA